ncbi:MAG: 30S ribosomal protein S8e [Candidatus Anstonellales archaeon]
MEQYHEAYRGKVSKGTGGKRIENRDKRLAHVGGEFASTKTSESEKKKMVRTKGGGRKIKLQKAVYVNVATDKGVKKAKILSVLEGNNPHYTRQNIITKGAIINTEIGKVKVTSRPGQDGVVNGVLIK